MPLLLVGVNHKTAPLSVREHFALSNDQAELLLGRLMEYMPHGVVLATCNRTEIYVTVHNAVVAAQHMQRFLADWTGISSEEITSLSLLPPPMDGCSPPFPGRRGPGLHDPGRRTGSRTGTFCGRTCSNEKRGGPGACDGLSSRGADRPARPGGDRHQPPCGFYQLRCGAPGPRLLWVAWNSSEC